MPCNNRADEDTQRECEEKRQVLCVCVCACVCARVCACACACVWAWAWAWVRMRITVAPNAAMPTHPAAFAKSATPSSFSSGGLYVKGAAGGEIMTSSHQNKLLRIR